MGQPSASMENGRNTSSAARTLDILQFLACRTHPVSATVIEAACGIPRSTAYTLLNLLKERRFVTYWRGERCWSVGPATSELSTTAPLFVHGLGGAARVCGHEKQPVDAGHRPASSAFPIHGKLGS